MKRRKSKKYPLVVALSLLVSGTMALSSCEGVTSKDSSTTSEESTADQTSTSAAPVVPEVTVSENTEVTWGSEVDTTSFFTIKVGDATQTVTTGMVTGIVNTKVEGTYPLTFSATVEGTVLTASCNVVVIPKVEITYPYTQSPVSYSSSLNIDTVVSCFQLSVDDVNVDINPTWITGEIGTDYGTYPFTLNAPVGNKVYKGTVNLIYTPYFSYLYSSYSETSPLEITQGTTTSADFDFTSLYHVGVASSSYGFYTHIVDADKSSSSDATGVILAHFDYSKVDFNTPGIYEVDATAATEVSSDEVYKSYIKIVSDLSITATSEENNWCLVGDETFDYHSLFTITSSLTVIDKSNLIYDIGDLDINKAGQYLIKVTYGTISCSVVMTVIDPSFFGTYSFADIKGTTYQCTYTFSSDGKAIIKWKTKPTYPENTITGKMAFASDGIGVISGANDNWNFKMQFDIKEGCIVRHLASTYALSYSYIYSYLQFFFKDGGEYTYQTIYEDSSNTSKVALDIIVVDKGGETQYWGVYRTYASYVWYVQGIDQGLEPTFDITKKTGTVTYPSVGDFTYSLTVASGKITALKHTNFVAEDVAPTDDAKISGIKFTNADDADKNLTFTIYSVDGGDKYSVTGNDLAYGTSIGGTSFVVSYDNATVTLVVFDGTANSSKQLQLGMKTIVIDRATSTYTSTEASDDSEIGGIYFGDDINISIFGKYAYVRTNVKTAFGFFGTITKGDDGIYTIAFDESTKSYLTKMTFKPLSNGNEIQFIYSDYSYSDFEGVKTYYSEGIKGNCYIKGNNSSISTSAAESLTNDDLKSLFTITKKNDDGTVEEVAAADYTVTTNTEINGAGIYTVTASYFYKGETYYSTVALSVIANPLEGADIVGTYQGFWSYGPAGMYHFEITEEGYIIFYKTTSTSASYACYLFPTSTENTYTYTQAGYTGTITYKDGAIYGTTHKGDYQTSMLTACRADKPSDVTCYGSTTGSGYNQAMLIVNNTTSKAYYHTFWYSGEVVAVEDTDVTDLPDLSGATTKQHFDIYQGEEAEDNLIAEFRYYTLKSSYGTSAIAESSDAYKGSFVDGENNYLDLDGYSGATYLSTSYTYSYGQNDRVVLSDTATGEAKYYFDIDSEKDKAKLLTAGDVTSDLAGKTYTTYVEYASQYRFPVTLTFDAYGFACFSGKAFGSEKLYLSYKMDGDNVIVYSNFVHGSKLTFTKEATGLYIYRGVSDVYITTALAFTTGLSLSEVTAD